MNESLTEQRAALDFIIKEIFKIRSKRDKEYLLNNATFAVFNKFDNL